MRNSTYCRCPNQNLQDLLSWNRLKVNGLVEKKPYLFPLSTPITMKSAASAVVSITFKLTVTSINALCALSGPPVIWWFAVPFITIHLLHPYPSLSHPFILAQFPYLLQLLDPYTLPFVTAPIECLLTRPDVILISHIPLVNKLLQLMTSMTPTVSLMGMKQLMPTNTSFPGHCGELNIMTPFFFFIPCLVLSIWVSLFRPCFTHPAYFIFSLTFYHCLCLFSNCAMLQPSTTFFDLYC